MSRYITIVLFFAAALLNAQPPKVELQPYGFDPVEIQIPATSNEKLLELSQNWAIEYNRTRNGHDITNVTDNSMTITAFKQNAFYYRNRGDAFDHRIKYEMDISFNRDRYTLTFKVTEIYLNNDKLIEYKIPDYYTSDGKLKDGYDGLENSLEVTVNDIIRSHYNFIVNFR